MKKYQKRPILGVKSGKNKLKGKGKRRNKVGPITSEMMRWLQK